jgi:hypothetical protein
VFSVVERYLVTPVWFAPGCGYLPILPGYPTLVLTVAAFLFLGLFVVAACETTRGRFVRLLADQHRDATAVRLPETVPATAAPFHPTKERDA